MEIETETRLSIEWRASSTRFLATNAFVFGDVVDVSLAPAARSGCVAEDDAGGLEAATQAESQAFRW